MRSFQSFAIVPAAGLSARMGRPKLLLPWGDRLLIDHVLSVWQASQVDRIFVVVRSDDRTLAERIVGDRVERVTPEVAPPDMKASVQAALLWIAAQYQPTSDDAWLMAPADLPYLSSLVIDRLLGFHETDRRSILVPNVEGRAGHPVLLPWDRASDVFQLAKDEGIRDLVARFPSERVDVDRPDRPVADEASDTATNSLSDVARLQREMPSLWQFQLDLDTPDDYQRAKEREKSGESQ